MSSLDFSGGSYHMKNVPREVRHFIFYRTLDDPEIVRLTLDNEMWYDIDSLF